jgi:hypothetical protein
MMLSRSSGLACWLGILLRCKSRTSGDKLPRRAAASVTDTMPMGGPRNLKVSLPPESCQPPRLTCDSESHYVGALALAQRRYLGSCCH